MPHYVIKKRRLKVKLASTVLYKLKPASAPVYYAHSLSVRRADAHPSFPRDSLRPKQINDHAGRVLLLPTTYELGGKRSSTTAKKGSPNCGGKHTHTRIFNLEVLTYASLLDPRQVWWVPYRKRR